MNPISVHYHSLEHTADRYCRDMEAWLKFREILPNPWLETRYEGIVDDLEREARRAIDFLKLPWDDCVLNYRDRLHDRPANSPSYAEVAEPLSRSRVGRWQNYEKYLQPVLSQLEPLVRVLDYV